MESDESEGLYTGIPGDNWAKFAESYEYGRVYQFKRSHSIRHTRLWWNETVIHEVKNEAE